jgi:hypothetical protein
LRDAIKQIEGIKLIQQEQQKKYFLTIPSLLSLWLLVALACQCIFRQALLYLESNDAVESAELVVGDYSEVDWKLVKAKDSPLPQDNRAKHQEDTPSTTHARQESKKEDSTNSTE